MNKIEIKKCKNHGNTEFILEARGSYRCKKCRSENVIKRRRLVKRKLVEEFGGKCCICGYNRCVGALHFHHINPKEKKFGISDNGITIAYKKLFEEAKKCVVVCSNCHAEIENNFIKIPP